MGKYDKGYAYPFTATAADVGMTYYAIVGKPEDEPPDPFDFIYSPWFIPLFILDLPFSLVTDVLTFPHDLYHIRDVRKQEVAKPKRENQNRVPNQASQAIGAPQPER